MSDVCVVVEGGGSGTRIGVLQGTAVTWRHGPTLDPHSSASETIGADLAQRIARDLAGYAMSTLRVVVAALSVASSPEKADHLAASTAAQLRQLDRPALDGVVVTNDIVPLLDWSPQRASVAAICGTGTGYASRDQDGMVRRASGLEYVLGDEGGGFDVGLAGLRAAARDFDGRGPRTALRDAAVRFGGGSFELLQEQLYGPGAVGLKTRVASFAADVLRLAARGDPVAVQIVHRSATEIVTGIRAVLAAIEPPSCVLTLAGSMLFAPKDRLLDAEVRRRLHDDGLVFESVTTLDSGCGRLADLGHQMLRGALQPVALAAQSRQLTAGFAAAGGDAGR